MIQQNTKVLKKFTPSERKEIIRGFEKLNSLISVFEAEGIAFEKIFNNDKIKYDVLGKNFYTFKYSGKDRSQIRVLYRFVRSEDGKDKFLLEMHGVRIKRRKGKEYIQEFTDYVNNYREVC